MNLISISRRVRVLVYSWALAALAVAPAAHLARGEDGVKLPAAREKFHLYLLIGQSNMAGRGAVEEEDNRLHERVLKFTKENTWAPATDPLHFDKPIAGVGLGSSFGRAMAEAEPGVTIGLIPCAVGGTPLSRWQKEGDLYQQAVERAKLAQKDGTLRGILWHQGESDSGKEETAKSYGERLAGMVRDLREELAAEDLPFVAGQLGEFLKRESAAGEKSFWPLVNEQLAGLPKAVKKTAVVSAAGLMHKGDQVHFDSPALRELGRRYAKAMLDLQRGEKPVGRPNVIFILSDDLAQGDLGCYGQKLIQTPHLDAMASEGTRFTQAYCGTSVCAPSRTSLMIGRHMGHSPIRANREIQPEGQKPLPPGTYTVAKLFHDHGYATACIGKWGMGMFDTPGSPLKVGFDHFFGYNCQRHAHSYFPAYLYRDDQRFELQGNDGKGVGKTYAQDLIADQCLAWIQANQDRPFFLFHSVTLPHGRHEIDDQGIYKDKPWSDLQKNYAAQVTRLDSDVGRILAKLKQLGLDERTLVIVAGDNGSSFAPSSEIGKLFDQTMGGKLRGYKRSLYEGGLRQACIARWPGHVPSGRVTDEPWAFWDFLPTCAELLGGKLPADVQTDGISILPLLQGGDAPDREYFYWELHEAGPSLQAVRFGNWKAVKNGPSAAVELYDLAVDPGEKTDLAKSKPELVAQAERLMAQAREDHPDWPLRDRPAGKKNAK